MNSKLFSIYKDTMSTMCLHYVISKSQTSTVLHSISCTQEKKLKKISSLLHCNVFSVQQIRGTLQRLLQGDSAVLKHSTSYPTFAQTCPTRRSVMIIGSGLSRLQTIGFDTVMLRYEVLTWSIVRSVHIRAKLAFEIHLVYVNCENLQIKCSHCT